MGFYYDDAGNIRAGLLDSEAQIAAETFVRTHDRKNKLNANQLRRFYNECKNLEKKYIFLQQKTQDGDSAFLQVLPLVKMLKAKVSYAANPSNPKIPRSFSDWMNKSIDAIENSKDFEAFLLSFEAVVGYCYGAGIS